MKTLLLSVLIISSILTPTISELCNPQDKKVLLQIKQHFGNPYLLASWKKDTDCCTSWYQVKCDSKTHRIISLTIFAGELNGTIPSIVSNLPYLETLMFHKLTNVTGQIPASISKLTHLKFLTLTWMNLSGSIPDFSPLKELNFLDLAFNKLSGSVPSSLVLLPSIEVIHLDRNRLTGPIPESFGAFKKKAPALYLSHNQLSGSIPASLGKMEFDTIDLSRNKLVGDASMLFGPNKSTQVLDISRNMFEFDLSKVVFTTNLGSIDMNHNKIYGRIPQQLTEIVGLQLLNVSYNRLCGKIPVGGKLQSFDYTNYFHNRCLCGSPLPSCKWSSIITSISESLRGYL